MTDLLAVHDITVTQQPFFGQGGAVKTQKRVTYFVGNHGPFTLTYDEGMGTADQIQADINKQVSELRVVTSATYTG